MPPRRKRCAASWSIAPGNGGVSDGGGAKRQPLERLDKAVPAPDNELLAIDEALGRLQQLHPQRAELIKLRYFAGLTIPEAAQALGVSVPTANRYWAYARAWLHEELAAGSDGPDVG